MIEHRKFPRIRFEAKCILIYEGGGHKGNVINISLGGAMISLFESAMIAQGETCIFRIFTEGRKTPDEIEIRVTYSTFTCIGLEFLAFNENTHPELYARIELLSRNPEKYRVAYP